MFTPFHKPPYTYPYGRSVDETTTIMEYASPTMRASLDPIICTKELQPEMEVYYEHQRRNEIKT
jgi:hypothetical protein